MITDFSLHISIDLGTETTKVAFSHQDKDGEVKSGIIKCQDVTFPGMVSYSKPLGKWLIGPSIEESADFAYDTLVRVKDMLSLLIPKKGKPDNTKYYLERNHFPKFYFPKKPDSVDLSVDFEEAINREQTFEARTTPKELCEEYFKVLFEKCINPKIYEIRTKQRHICDVKYISVYPSKANKAYIEELERLIKIGAGLSENSDMVKSLSAPKATAVGAYYQGLISKDEHTLLVDIGERDISVSKVCVISSGNGLAVMIDGADGHNPPKSIGGADIDQCLGELINNKALNREVLGSGLHNTVGEMGTYRQQYLLLRHIKGVKKCFSLPEEKFNLIFPSGVPVCVKRDVDVEIKITKEEFLQAVFKKPDSVGNKIVAYVQSELERPSNKQVTSVILVGGSASSHFLCDYLDCKVQSKQQVAYKLLDSGSKAERNENAASIGAAIISPAGIDLKTVSALAYGTWKNYSITPNVKYKCFDVLLNYGEEINPKGEVRVSHLSARAEILDDEFYSFPGRIDTRQDGNGNYIKPFLVGKLINKNSTLQDQNEDRNLRFTAFQKGLKVVSGKKGSGRIYFTDRNGRYFNLNGRMIYFVEGFEIDADGHAHPFVKNDVRANASDSELASVIVRCDGLEDFDIEED